MRVPTRADSRPGYSTSTTVRPAPRGGRRSARLRPRRIPGDDDAAGRLLLELVEVVRRPDGDVGGERHVQGSLSVDLKPCCTTSAGTLWAWPAASRTRCSAGLSKGVTISRAPRTARAKWPSCAGALPACRAATESAQRSSARAVSAPTGSAASCAARAATRPAAAARERAPLLPPQPPRASGTQHVAALQACESEACRYRPRPTTAPSQRGVHAHEVPVRHAHHLAASPRTDCWRFDGADECVAPAAARRRRRRIRRPARDAAPAGSEPAESPERRCVEAGGVDVGPRADRLQPAADQLRRQEAAREQLDFGDVAEVDPSKRRPSPRAARHAASAVIAASSAAPRSPARRWSSIATPSGSDSACSGATSRTRSAPGRRVAGSSPRDDRCSRNLIGREPPERRRARARRERLEQAAHDLQVMRSVDGDPYVAERAPELDDVHVESAVVEIARHVLAIGCLDRLAVGPLQRRSCQRLDVHPHRVRAADRRCVRGEVMAIELADDPVDHHRVEERAIGGESHDHIRASRGGSAGIAGEHVMLAAAEDAGAGGGRDVGDRIVATLLGRRHPDSVERGRLLDAVEHRREQRPAGDDGERLARQAGRAHAGLDDRDDTRHSAGEASGRRRCRGRPAHRDPLRRRRDAWRRPRRALSPARHGLRGGGARSTFIGKLDGLAARLARTAGLPLEAPADGPLGVDPARFDAAVVDLYDTDVCPLARALPVATPAEASHCEEAGVRVDYHLDRDASEDGPRLLAGPTYAPVDPAFTRARRDRREVRRALVTLGGSAAVHGQAPLLTAAAAQAFPRAQLPTTGLPAADGLEVERLPEQSTMLDAITRADIAITAAGMTAYELACAGVPFLALVVAGNQERVGRALEQTGQRSRLTPAPDWTATRSVNASSSSRTLPGGRMPAAAGPRAIDGDGARRATAALVGRWGFER